MSTKTREHIDRMSQIIYDTEKIKAYDGLKTLCEYAGKSAEWCDELWLTFLTEQELYKEFIYYLEHHSFSDRMKAAGYSLTDCYVWQMEQYNLKTDSGKNTASCNKEEMVLQAFQTMAEVKKEPEHYKRKLNEGPTLDRE